MERTLKMTKIAMALLIMAVIAFAGMKSPVSADVQPLDEEIHTVTFSVIPEGCSVKILDEVTGEESYLEGTQVKALREDDIAFMLELQDGYSLKSAPQVYVDGALINESMGYYRIENVMADRDVVIAGVVKDSDKLRYSKITKSVPKNFTLKYLTALKKSTIIKGGMVRFTVKPAAAYSASKFTVKAGKTTLKAVDGIYSFRADSDTKITVKGTAKKNTSNMKYVFDKSLFKVTLDGKTISNGAVKKNKGKTQTLKVKLKGDAANCQVIINGDVVQPGKVSGSTYTFKIKAAEKASTVYITKLRCRVNYRKDADYGVRWEITYPKGSYESVPYGSNLVFNVKLLYGYTDSDIEVVYDGSTGYHVDVKMEGTKVGEGEYQYKFENIEGNPKIYVAKKDAAMVTYQRFDPNTYTVRFIDGSSSRDVEVEYGSCVAAQKTSGSDMDWYTSAGRAYDFKKPVNGNLNLYAK